MRLLLISIIKEIPIEVIGNAEHTNVKVFLNPLLLDLLEDVYLR
jgi:hypothetical protein